MKKIIFALIIGLLALVSCAAPDVVYEGFTCHMADRSVQYKILKDLSHYQVWAFDEDNSLQLMIYEGKSKDWARSMIQGELQRNCKILGGIVERSEEEIIE